MNYKSLLLTGVAVLLSSQAMAADLTNPFFTPKAGEFTSDTAMTYSRGKAKHNWGLGENWIAQETLEYGVNDTFSINGSIVNYFDTQRYNNNDHNFMYNIGAKYNTRHNKLLFQAGVNYRTADTEDLYGIEDGEWMKILQGTFKIGYEIDETLTSYVSYGLSSQIDTGSRPLSQTLKLGAHKYNGKYALDAAVRYVFETEGHNTNEWWVDAQADYYLKDNLAIGAFGTYFVAGSGSNVTDYSYQAGAHIKFLF